MIIKSFKQHWYTIRKIANYWFNLNSLLKKPQLISDTYLSILLAQLEADGYSIFVASGELNKTQADIKLYENPLNVKQILASYKTQRSFDNDSDNEDDELKKVIEMSLRENDKDLDMNRIAKSSYPSAVFDEDSQLNQAIQMSLQTNLTTTATSNQNVTELSPNTIRRKRLEHFEQLNKKE